MKHFYRRLILCIVIFLLIFILFINTNTNTNINNNKNTNKKEGLLNNNGNNIDVTSTKRLLKNSNINSIISNFSYLFVNLRKESKILDSNSKIKFGPIKYIHPSFTSAELSQVIGNSKTNFSLDQNAIQRLAKDITDMYNRPPPPIKTPQPTTKICTRSVQGRGRCAKVLTDTCEEVIPPSTIIQPSGPREKLSLNVNPSNLEGSTTNYNVITDKYDNYVTTDIYHQNYNGSFAGLDEIMEQMIVEIFRLTLIESNIIYLIRKENATNTHANGVLLFSIENPNLISNIYDKISQVNVEDTLKMLNLGAFKTTNINGKTIKNIIDDIKANDYKNISTYFDDNIIYDNNATVIYKSNLNFDNTISNTPGPPGLGTHRTHLNNQRNSLIYKVCLMSKLYIQSNLINSTVYADLKDYLG
jgi:hypothetical protein